jgi:hypothetical protein
MSDKDMINGGKLHHLQIAYAGTGIDQDVVVDQERGGAQIAAYPAATS